MSQPPPTADLAGRRTRQRVLEAAVRLLARRGLSGELLDDAAAEAGCPLDRARVYFRRDEDLVLALYARLAADLAARVLELPEGTVAERFHALMTAKLALAGPYRDAFAALLATLLDPRHALGALSAHTEIIRGRVLGVFAAAVQGASDCPPDPAPLVRSLYGAHLALMLLWTQDRTPDGRATRGALDLARDLLATAGPFLSLPMTQALVARCDGVFGPLVEPPLDPQTDRLARAVLLRLFRHRRLGHGAGACADAPCEQCLALHLPKVRRFLLAAEPIHLLLPAFPAKSPSRRKTLGPLPDKAEELALAYLDNVCTELRELYPPGARLTVCSDGRVFGDLVGVSDEDVTAYGREVVALLRRLGSTAIDTFAMEDLYETTDFAAMRRQLCADYAQPLEAVVEAAHRFEHHRALFNGIHRFLFEEHPDLDRGRSRTQIREECKGRAYEVIRRSDAWGRLIADCFPTALRLSIHPQHPHADKIGVLLGNADDVWLTPWHGVAVRFAGGWKFLKRDEAEALGARLVEQDGRPSHYEAEAPAVT